MNRIYPHVMVMASQPLDRLSAVISVERPAKTMHSGKIQPANPDTGEHDEMKADIGPVLFTDSNKNAGPALFKLLPLWNHIFDYYSVDPIAAGITGGIWVDPTKTAKRTGANAIQRLKLQTYEDGTVTKMPRQGEFDNIHVAPRMRAPERIAPAKGWQLDNIVMAPFCWHDCLHMHTRWSVEYTDKQNLGFDDKRNPYTTPGAPMVPHDQTVRVSILPPAGFAYEAIIDPHPATIESGAWQVFYHHGMGYANEIWDKSLFSKAMAGLELALMDEKNWSPTTAANSVALFYWRLRWGGNKAPMERIRFVNPDSLSKLRKF